MIVDRIVWEKGARNVTEEENLEKSTIDLKSREESTLNKFIWLAAICGTKDCINDVVHIQKCRNKFTSRDRFDTRRVKW